VRAIKLIPKNFDKIIEEYEDQRPETLEWILAIYEGVENTSAFITSSYLYTNRQSEPEAPIVLSQDELIAWCYFNHEGNTDTDWFDISPLCEITEWYDIVEDQF
jgi:hypothetical protein